MSIIDDIWRGIKGIFVAGIIVGIIIIFMGKTCVSCGGNVDKVVKHSVVLKEQGLPNTKTITLYKAVFETMETGLFDSKHWKPVREISIYCKTPNRVNLPDDQASFGQSVQTISLDEVFSLQFRREGLFIQFSEDGFFYWADRLHTSLRVRGKKDKREMIFNLQIGKPMDLWIYR